MLVHAFAAAGVSLQQQHNLTKKELKEFATKDGVELFEDKELVNQGREGQPNGLMQALLSLLEPYKLEESKNPITGQVNLQSLLCHILANCNDFKDREIALEYFGTQLGVTLRLTPKLLSTIGLIQSPSVDISHPCHTKREEEKTSNSCWFKTGGTHCAHSLLVALKWICHPQYVTIHETWRTSILMGCRLENHLHTSA